MADPDDDKLWEVQSKGLNYLLIAHAAGLVACLTLLKDYDTTPRLKGVGVFVWLFGLGLMSTIATLTFLFSRRQAQIVGRTEGRLKTRLAVLFLQPSYLLLFAAIIVAIWKFGKL
jgi:hypothetical protein